MDWSQSGVRLYCLSLGSCCGGRTRSSNSRTASLNEQERRDFLEICDDRYNRRSTILTSQLPVEKWHAQIGDPTIADSILDRVVHNAYRIELSGESIRKKKGRGSAEDRPGGAA